MTPPLFRSSAGRTELYASPLGARLVLWGDGCWLADYLTPDDRAGLAKALVDSPTAVAALDAATVVVDADPYPYLLSMPELADVPLERCEDCDRTVQRDQLIPDWDDQKQRTLWVGPGCYRKRRRECRGGVQLAITSQPEGSNTRA